MNTEITPNLSEVQSEELLTWHKPEIQRITISLDTSFTSGSNTDGSSGSTAG